MFCCGKKVRTEHELKPIKTEHTIRPIRTEHSVKTDSTVRVKHSLEIPFFNSWKKGSGSEKKVSSGKKKEKTSVKEGVVSRWKKWVA